MRDFAGHWFQNHAQVRCKPSTCRRYWQILRIHIVPEIGDLKLDEVRRVDIEVIIAKKQKESAPKTVNHYLGVLTRMFRSAVEWDVLERSPCDGVQRLKEPPPETHFWDFDQAAAFLDAAAAEPEWHLLFLTAMKTGMRQGELFALRWSAVDMDRKVIEVRESFTHGRLTTTKGNRSRRVPMTKALEHLLTERMGCSDDLVFGTIDGKKPTNSRARRAMERFIKASGVDRIRFHDLRHTFASHLVMHGVPLNTVRELLGHKDLKMTLRYAHLTPDTTWSAIQCLDAPPRHISRHTGENQPALMVVNHR